MAWVILSDAPASVINAAKCSRGLLGDLVQVCDGANDEVEILAAINALPEMGGASVNTKKGQVKVIGTTVALGALMDFPPVQDFLFDARGTVWIGAGIRLDSTMNAEFHFGILAAATGGVSLECYPRTIGPDGLNPAVFNANVLHIQSLVAEATRGLYLNNTAVAFNANAFIVDEWSTASYTTAFSMAAADIYRNKILVPVNPSVHIFNSINIEIADSLATALRFDTESYDYLSLHSPLTNPSRVTINVPGEYSFGGCVKWAVSAVGTRELSVRLNGSTNLVEDRRQANTGGLFDYQTIQGTYILQSGDYMELMVFQRSGAALNVLADGVVSPTFWMHKIN